MRNGFSSLTANDRIDDTNPTRRFVILGICCSSLFLVSIDNTIVNVALPSLGRDFHASVSGLQWTVDAYTLVIASLLMISGSTADRVGRRRVFQVGLGMFSLGSLLCSVAPNLATLVAFRMLQGVGGSMLNPVAMSIITNTFTDPKERARAIGVWGAVIGVGMALGPILGGVFVSSIGWRSIFWINVPVGLVALVLAGRYVPDSKAHHARAIDPIGQILVFVILVSLTYGIIEGPRQGWLSPEILGSLSLALLAVVVFIAYERQRPEPLVDLRYFRSVPFSGANIAAVSAFGALGGFLFLNTLYLQDVRHLSALSAGFDTLPMAFMAGVIPPLSGRIVASRGPRIPLILGGAAMTLGAATLVGVGAHTPFSELFLSYGIFGFGFGFINAPITNSAVSGMPRSQAGVAAAIASTSRQVGQALGVAVVGALVGGVIFHGVGVSSNAISRAPWIVVVILGAVIFVSGFLTTSEWARQTARQSAKAFAARGVSFDED